MLAAPVAGAKRHCQGLVTALHGGEDVHDHPARDDQRHRQDGGQIRFLLVEDHRTDGDPDDAEAAPERIGHPDRNGAHGAGEGEVAQAVGADDQYGWPQFAETVGLLDHRGTGDLRADRERQP